MFGFLPSFVALVRCPCVVSWQPCVNNFLKKAFSIKQTNLSYKLNIKNMAYCHSNVQTLLFYHTVQPGLTKGSFGLICLPRTSSSSHSLWPVALACEMHQSPLALGFPTQLPGSILIPITWLILIRLHPKLAKEQLSQLTASIVDQYYLPVMLQ